ncbi:MAG: alanine--tRNA ligase [Candidatus Shapirobacteria bacterium]|jgi:alanyl-tRNA synthetase
MLASELKKQFVDFFVQKNHQEIPSASLVPENDSTTLFISAGMHPLVPYLLGQPHPLGKRLVNVQKCVRTGDIDEVGDKYHHTFFEMLGNWSLGDYFKETMIPWSYEFLTKVLKYNPLHLHVTCFAGDTDAPKDEESARLWQSAGIPQERIHFLPKKDNWWGPAGTTGPCGPDSEMFIDTHPELGPIDFEVGCKQGRILELGNDVFMQYNKTPGGSYELLPQKNVDTGYGVERNLAIYEGLDDDYQTAIWQPIIKEIEALSGMKYGDKSDEEYIAQGQQCWVDVRRSMRIIADHLRAAVFIIADGVEASNKDRGYVLRRLVRRAVRQGRLLSIPDKFIARIGNAAIENHPNYAGTYPELTENKDKIISMLQIEEDKFLKTIDNGLRQIQKFINSTKTLTGADAFVLYESYGFPLEMTMEEITRLGLEFTKKDVDDFNQAKIDHQKQSQTLSAGKFKSGLADNSEIITKYHTVTHLLHAALRRIIGTHVRQSGSNITSERLRFDFSHPDKLTPDQINKVEQLVNQQISQALPVTVTTQSFSEASQSGALAFFGTKYPDTVSVYTIGDSQDYFSKEVCAGPHVTNTKELGEFKIIKEETAGSGKRRIYATLS